MPTYQATSAGYANLWNRAKLRPSSSSAAKNTAEGIIANRERYEVVAKRIGHPTLWPLIGALHDRESSGDFDGVLHNGEEIIGKGRRTRLEPPGRGPFSTWENAAVDALTMPGKTWDKIKDWPISRWLYEAEKFNGFGYFSRGVNSPYVWAGTDLQQRGKYVADGVWNSSTWDSQLGVAAVLKAIFAIQPGLNPDKDDDMAKATEEVSEDVPVKSPLFSKINWTQVGAGVLSIATLLAEGLPPAEKVVAITAINLVSNALTIVFRVWFNRSVTRA